MILCAKCENDTRSTTLVTAQGEVMVQGPMASMPQPILAQVCTACGYIELYAPQPISRPEASVAMVEQELPDAALATAPTA